MKTFNFVKILLFTVVTLGFASCGDDVYYTMQNSDEKLCGKVWVKSSDIDGGRSYTYILKFDKNNEGYETTVTYDSSGKTTVEKEFSWRWGDNSKESLRLNFRDTGVKYFDNVWVRDHYLSGELDGEAITLTDSETIK